jgi:hypothetical protein
MKPNESPNKYPAAITGEDIDSNSRACGTVAIPPDPDAASSAQLIAALADT